MERIPARIRAGLSEKVEQIAGMAARVDFSKRQIYELSSQFLNPYSVNNRYLRSNDERIRNTRIRKIEYFNL